MRQGLAVAGERRAPVRRASRIVQQPCDSGGVQRAAAATGLDYHQPIRRRENPVPRVKPIPD